MPVRYESRGNVALISIERPDRRNAINLETAELLGDAWLRFDSDEEACLGILTGAGGVFSSGADLKDFDLVDRPEGFLGFTRMTVSKPTIAAVEGYCVAGGLEMALWCDLRVAGEGAVFGCFERRFGVPLVDGGTQRLPRLVGLSRAMDLVLTGRPVDAGEALRIGLADRVVPDGTAVAAALELAATIAAFPQPTVRSDRMAMLEGLGRPLAEGLEIERLHGLGVLDLAAEGSERFEKGAGRHGGGLV
ncbi:MAG: crotonase/enoyl-CoA hydratase family protein [Acidimicrobiia bacterium]|nr:crotonase/enoyl-CoA hydratase family protein [Acidimicrobiia bacterium]